MKNGDIIYNAKKKSNKYLVRISNPDPEKLADLVLKAKGSRSINGYARELGVSASTISRLLNQKTRSVNSDCLIQAIADNIDPESGISRDEIFLAHGVIERDMIKDLYHQMILENLHKRHDSAQSSYMQTSINIKCGQELSKGVSDGELGNEKGLARLKEDFSYCRSDLGRNQLMVCEEKVAYGEYGKESSYKRNIFHLLKEKKKILEKEDLKLSVELRDIVGRDICVATDVELSNLYGVIIDYEYPNIISIVNKLFVACYLMPEITKNVHFLLVTSDAYGYQIIKSKYAYYKIEDNISICLVDHMYTTMKEEFQIPQKGNASNKEDSYGQV